MQACLQLEKEELRFLLLAALLLPLRACMVPGPKGKPTPAAAFIAREAIKWRTKDADMAVLLHETVGGDRIDYLLLYIVQLLHI